MTGNYLQQKKTAFAFCYGNASVEVSTIKNNQFMYIDICEKGRHSACVCASRSCNEAILQCSEIGSNVSIQSTYHLVPYELPFAPLFHDVKVPS